MNIHFILSHPAVPENIGFTCRAMKTVGFRHLRLVNPKDHLGQKARKTAYGSHDLLESALIYEDMSSALVGIDLVVGTTAKNRVGRHDYHNPEALVSLLRQKEGVVENVGLVFGSERNGLSSEEITLCDLLTTIPLATEHPSLNLAQAVMVYAYEISKASLSNSNMSKPGPATDQAKLKSAAFGLLDKLELKDHGSLYQRLKDRLMVASAEDTSLILALSRFINRKLD